MREKKNQRPLCLLVLNNSSKISWCEIIPSISHVSAIIKSTKIYNWLIQSWKFSLSLKVQGDVGFFFAIVLINAAQNFDLHFIFRMFLILRPTVSDIPHFPFLLFRSNSKNQMNLFLFLKIDYTRHLHPLKRLQDMGK